MIEHHSGSILSSNANITVQQVNCQGVMGSGLAKEIKAHFPECYDGYKIFCKGKQPKDLLGKVNLVSVRIVNDNSVRMFANIFGQLNYGRERKLYTSYQALKKGLTEVRDFAQEHNLTVAVPYGIGCGLGGGDWDIVCGIIDKVFGKVVDHSTVPCEIWKLI